MVAVQGTRNSNFKKLNVKDSKEGQLLMLRHFSAWILNRMKSAELLRKGAHTIQNEQQLKEKNTSINGCLSEVRIRLVLSRNISFFFFSICQTINSFTVAHTVIIVLTNELTTFSSTINNQQPTTNANRRKCRNKRMWLNKESEKMIFFPKCSWFRFVNKMLSLLSHHFTINRHFSHIAHLCTYNLYNLYYS